MRFDVTLDWTVSSIADIERVLEKMRLVRESLGPSLLFSESVKGFERAAACYTRTSSCIGGLFILEFSKFGRHSGIAFG